MTLRLSGAVAQLFDLPTPDELEPVVVALLLGVVTDYVVFFCASLREVHERSAGGPDADGVDEVGAPDLAYLALVRSGPIVAVAGIAVATGTATAPGRRVPLLPCPGSGARVHGPDRPARGHLARPRLDGGPRPDTRLLARQVAAGPIAAIRGRTAVPAPLRPPDSSDLHLYGLEVLVAKIASRRAFAVGAPVSCTVGVHPPRGQRR